MAKADSLKKIIDRNSRELAFIVGNGINRYSRTGNNVSWEDLLLHLWEKVSFRTISRCPAGISLTEFYDILEAVREIDVDPAKEIASLLDKWEPEAHHRAFIERARLLDVPVLTTNFDETLSRTSDLVLEHTDGRRFTDHYPWGSCFKEDQDDFHMNGFGIWHINGMIRYPRSIRLGLGHYMGSLGRASDMIHKGDDCLYSYSPTVPWKGLWTWLDLIFHSSLFIFGLALETDETFLRWLLIERMKYYRKFPARKQKGWYVHCGAGPDDISEGKRMFLESFGFEILTVDSYPELYEDLWK